jgi:hypothetical protein
MSDARKRAMAILAQVAEFLANLPEDQLDDLQSGAARLTLIPANSDQPLPVQNRSRTTRATKERVPPPEMAGVAEQLTGLDSRERAEALLKPLKVAEIKDVALALGIPTTGLSAKDKLISAIVERTVGSRLDSLAIRGTATLPY